MHQGGGGQAADQRRGDHQQHPAQSGRADRGFADRLRARPAPAVDAHWPTWGSWGVRRNVTSWGPVLTSAAEQIQPASTCVVRTALPQPIGGLTHTWYCPAGTFAENSRAEFSAPDTTLVSVPFFSTFTWLPERLRPSVLSWTTLTVSLCAGPLVADALALALAVGVAPCAGSAGVDAWPVNPPMTSTATNAAACANSGAASFLRSSMITGRIPSSHGSALLPCHGPGATAPTRAGGAAWAGSWWGARR